MHKTSVGLTAFACAISGLLGLRLLAGGAPTKEGKAPISPISVSSPGFGQGAVLPKEYTADGSDVSPALQWRAVPAQAQSLALICSDPDAPGGTWIHWVIFNLPAKTSGLAKAISSHEQFNNGTRQGKNSFNHAGYGGPSPPPGKVHRYFFTVYALDCLLKLDEGATAATLQQAMLGHILAQGQLMGTYKR